MLLGPARPPGRRAARLLQLALMTASLLCFGASAASAATFTRGFEDDVWFNGGWQPWMQKVVSTGAKEVSLEVDWAHVEPDPPSSGAGSASPASSSYDFAYIDNVLKRFRGSGIRPVLLVTDAPRWAQGNGGTDVQYAEGGYEPNDAALEQFVHALAARYSGHYPDPANPGHSLPRVTYFQAWAEANMGYHLSPQWSRIGSSLVNTGPVIYRNLLNAFFAGIRAGDPSARVVFSGLESYGDPRGGMRTPPVTFLRDVLCLSSRLVRQACPDPAHFDVLASDPYDVGPPTLHAVSSNDASAPDLGRLTRVLDVAISAHTVLPVAPKPLWVTEFGYDSNPPNTTKGAISEAEQARWLEESFYVFAHEGVSTVVWYLLHDQVGSFTTAYFSGVYFHDGGAKTSLTAYEFPFVVMANGAAAQAWGIAPRTGTVRIQRKMAGAWVTAFTLRCRAGAVFARIVPRAAYGLYRAVESRRTSLDWRYRRGTRAGGSPPGILIGSALGAR